jgi:hypothetical protein
MSKKFYLLALLATVLAMIVSNAAAADPQLNGQNIDFVTVANTGGTPIDIVAVQTNLALNQQVAIPATNTAGTNSLMTANNAQDTSQMNSGSDAQPVTVQPLADNASSGGSSHTGKYLYYAYLPEDP